MNASIRALPARTAISRELRDSDTRMKATLAVSAIAKSAAKMTMGSRIDMRDPDYLGLSLSDETPQSMVRFRTSSR